MIWPFKSSVMGAKQAVCLSNRIPDSFGTHEIVTLGAFLAGASIATLMIWIQKKSAGEEE